VNPSVAFTLILLSLMIGSGIVSASWGYALGRQALTGVRQPESRPANGSATMADSSHQQLRLVQEEEILDSVEARISGNLASPDAASDRTPN